MSELLAVVTIKFKPEKLDEAKQLLEWIAAETHKEEGALLFAFHEDRSDPSKITLIERWTSREAFEAHDHTEHFAKAVAAMPELVSEPAVVTILAPLRYGDPAKGVLA